MIGLNLDIKNAYNKAVCMNDQIATILQKKKDKWNIASIDSMCPFNWNS